MTESPSSRSQQRVLVTGGGGFLGRAIVQKLIVTGNEVRSFSRKDYPELREWGVEVVQGDLADKKAVSAACSDRDVVFHVAGKVNFWGAYRDYFSANVCGTDNIIAGCRERGVGRLVFTSSPSAVFDGKDMNGVNESVPYPKHPISHYSATKALAEQHVLTANSHKLRTLALRPHLIWGPGDNHIIPRLIARAKSRKLRRIGDGNNKIDATYIDNAALAHTAAARALENNPKAAGRAYFISNDEPVLLWELIEKMIEIYGLPTIQHSISRSKAKFVAGFIELFYKTLRIKREPPLTRALALELSTSHWFDISSAKRELGYRPEVSMEEGFQRLGDWIARDECIK